MAYTRRCTSGQHASCSAGYCGCNCHKDTEPSQPAAPLLHVSALADALGFRISGDDRWRDDAACAKAGLPVELFFVDPSSNEKQTPGSAPGEARALRVCATCPVRPQCLADQLTWEKEERRRPYGISGGTTPTMRASRRVRGLDLHEKAEVLTEWFENEIMPTIMAPIEAQAS